MRSVTGPSLSTRTRGTVTGSTSTTTTTTTTTTTPTTTPAPHITANRLPTTCTTAVTATTATTVGPATTAIGPVVVPDACGVAAAGAGWFRTADRGVRVEGGHDRAPAGQTHLRWLPAVRIALQRTHAPASTRLTNFLLLHARPMLPRAVPPRRRRYQAPAMGVLGWRSGEWSS